jgi:hypothetical protein
MLTRLQIHTRPADAPPAEAFEAAAALRSRIGDLMMAACMLERSLGDAPSARAASVRSEAIAVLASHLRASADHVVRLSELCGDRS